MSFVKRIIGPDEKFVGIATIHWIYALKGILWLIGLVILGLIIDRGFIYFSIKLFGAQNPYVFEDFGNVAIWICLITGALVCILYTIMWIATEVGLTTKRIIYKRGLIFVDTKEVDLEEIKAAEVDNGIFGTALNYGYVFLDSRFIQNMNLPAIKDPYRFLKTLNNIRSKIKSDSATIILDERSDVEKIKQNTKSPLAFDQPKEERRKILKSRFKNAFKKRSNNNT